MERICKYCLEGFSSSASLSSHIKDKHPGCYGRVYI
jgi:hypothetical protein